MIFILSDSGIKLYKKIRQSQYVNIKLEIIKYMVIMLITIVVSIVSSFIEIYISTNFLLFLKEFL